MNDASQPVQAAVRASDWDRPLARAGCQGKMKSVVIIIDYYGKWPFWFDLFLASCARNPTINWLINTDCPTPTYAPKNVKFVFRTKAQYLEHISRSLGIEFNPLSMYSICNLKPAFGYIYEEDIIGYDYYGWGDLDVVYGNLRAFFTNQALTHDVISSHDEIISGHLALFINEDRLRKSFMEIPNWAERMASSVYGKWDDCLDEVECSILFSPDTVTRQRLRGSRHEVLPDRGYWKSSYFSEQWSTPFTPSRWWNGNIRHPDVWLWCDGSLTNNRDGAKEFAYLHFMNFKRHWYIDRTLYGTLPTWDDYLPSLQLDFKYQEIDSRQIRLNRSGIHLLRHS